MLLQSRDSTVQTHNVSNHDLVGNAVLVDEVRVGAESGQHGAGQETEKAKEKKVSKNTVNLVQL